MIKQNVPLSWVLYSRTPFTDEYYAELDMAAAGGVKRTVLHNGVIKYLTSNMSDCAKLRRDIEERGMLLCDAHAPFSPNENLGYPVERDRKWIHELQKNSLRVAGMLGLKTLTMHIGRLCFHPDIAESTPEAVKKYTLEILDDLLPVAEENNVIIALENLFHPTATCDELPAYIEHYNSPYLGICFDSGHANVVEKETTKTPDQMDEMIKLAWPDRIITYRENCIEKMAPHIVTTHLHDNNGRGDHHQLPGTNGNIDWQRVCTVLAGSCPRLVSHQSEADKETFNTTSEGIAAFADLGFFV